MSANTRLSQKNPSLPSLPHYQRYCHTRAFARGIAKPPREQRNQPPGAVSAESHGSEGVAETCQEVVPTMPNMHIYIHKPK